MNDTRVERNKESEEILTEAVTAEERRNLIAVAAYYRAERRGFAPGGELNDWVEAEAEINEQLGTQADSEPGKQQEMSTQQAGPAL